MSIISILAAIALPSFLNQANRAKQAKAINEVGAINRAQNAFYYENSEFAASLEELGFSYLQGEADYQYTLSLGGSSAQLMTISASPVDTVLKGYSGLVYTTIDAAKNQVLSSLVCTGDAGTSPILAVNEINGTIAVSGCQGS